MFNKYSFLLDVDIKDNLWTINRVISMDKDLLIIMSQISKYFFTLKEGYYKLLYWIILQVNSVRNKYIKIDNEKTELLLRYSKFFRTSMRETKQYLELLRKDCLEEEIYKFVGLDKGEKISCKTKKGNDYEDY